MFPSKYFKASDCEDGELTLTIDSLRRELIGQGSQAEEKYVLYFEGEDRGLVLNKTNSTTIARLHGEDTNDWIGKQITLFATEVPFQGEVVDALRVRSKLPKRPAKGDSDEPPF
jgi:hypothetical protein